MSGETDKSLQATQADLNEIDFAIDGPVEQSRTAPMENDVGNDSRVNFLANLLGLTNGAEDANPSHQALIENEWNDVPVIEAKFVDPEQVQPSQAIVAVSQPNQPSVLLHFKPAWDQLTRNVNLSELIDPESENQGNVQSSGCYEFLKCLVDKADLDERLTVSKNLIIKLTQTPFDNADELHIRILQTIYKKLTNSSIDCPRYGSHWELIGFQGNDPATDLRGCGMLSLILLIYILDSEYLETTHDIFALSKHETQNFPFCVVGINLVSLLVKYMNKGTLNKHFNQIHSLNRHLKHKASVNADHDATVRYEFASVCGKFFMALFLEFYMEWKSGVKTISDFGFVLNDLDLKATGSAKFLFKQLDVHLFNQKFKKGHAVQMDVVKKPDQQGPKDQIRFTTFDD